MLSIRNLSHSYGKKEVLHDLCTDVAQGEIFALLGPNGGGKTTLFRILSTLLPPQKGSVLIAGFDLSENPAAIRSRMGVLFQHPALDKKLKVSENLRCNGLLYGLHGNELENQIVKCAAAVGLSDRLGDSVETLSGGMQRRAEIAKAILPSPSLLLLDEPSTGLDPSARIACWEIFSELRKQGITIVLTTHLMEEAEKADRAAILHCGTLVASGSPSDLCRELGEFLLILRCACPEKLAPILNGEPGVSFRQIGKEFRITAPDPSALASAILHQHPDWVESSTIARPSLDDVFAQKTGMTLSDAETQND